MLLSLCIQESMYLVSSSNLQIYRGTIVLTVLHLALLWSCILPQYDVRIFEIHNSFLIVAHTLCFITIALYYVMGVLHIDHFLISILICFADHAS